MMHACTVNLGGEGGWALSSLAARPFTQSLRWERVCHSKLVLHTVSTIINCIRCGQLVLIVREVRFNSFLRAALMIALLNNCLVAKTSRAIFFHLHSDVTSNLNQFYRSKKFLDRLRPNRYGSLTRPFPA